jgi:hypothetical protein
MRNRLRWISPLLLLGVLGLAAPAAAQTTAGPLDSVAWDYADADLATFSVTQFQVCTDAQTGSACTLIPLTAKFTPTAGQTPPPVGSSSYKWKLPALIIGAHTVKIGACTAGATPTCSSTPLAISFSFVIDPPPPVGVRLIRG